MGIESFNSEKGGSHRIRPGFEIAALLASLSILVAAALLSTQPDWVDRYYSNGWSRVVGAGLSLVSGQFSISLAEILILALLLWLAASALLGWRNIRQRRSGWGQSVRKGLLRLLTAASVLAALFYLTWGLNYSRPPMDVRMGWQQPGVQERDPQQELQELSRLCLELVEAANQAYLEAHGGKQWQQGRAPVERSQIDSAIDEGFRRAAARLGPSGSWGASRGPAKPARVSLLMSYLGISGIYFPFTAEAHFNAMAPDIQLPHIMAHEKAHQRGIASEDEASMAGFLACLDSVQPYVRYSGLVFAQRQLQGELLRRDPDQARQLAAKRLEAVQKDISEAIRFWQSFEGPATRLGERVNDSYLKFHGVRGGIESYRFSARLIVLFARSRGGSIL